MEGLKCRIQKKENKKIEMSETEKNCDSGACELYDKHVAPHVNEMFMKEVSNMFDPTFNHFALTKEHNGKKMDYFGYLANTLTDWKQQQVFNSPLELRAPVVVFSTAIVAWSKYYTIRRFLPKLSNCFSVKRNDQQGR